MIYMTLPTKVLEENAVRTVLLEVAEEFEANRKQARVEAAGIVFAGRDSQVWGEAAQILRQRAGGQTDD